ncbi:MAG: NmrA family NAD(P)-binding protein [Candidatus Kapaibacteriota bacterium]
MGHILITGATGNLGKAVINALKRADEVPFVSALRNPAEARTVELNSSGNQYTTVTFDYTKPETFKNATKGIDKVFLLAPPLQQNAEALLTPFLDFLKTETTIRRVVYIGALGSNHLPPLSYHQALAQKVSESQMKAWRALLGVSFHNVIGKKLEDDGFQFTIVKPSFFAQNFGTFDYENITQRGITFNVAGEGKTAFIDINDIANVVATVFTEHGHEYVSYDVTGPELLTHFDAATLLSDILGKPIVYPNPSEEDFIAALKHAGVPEFVISYLISVYSLIKDNKTEILTSTVERLTGKKPTPLRQVLINDFSR